MRRSFREYVREHFYITTAGNFSQPALQCAIAELGVERILFGVDWPFQPNGDAVAFVNEAKLEPGAREQIFGANARRLLRIPICGA
jgi:predicted TIM-barrel fold metal-dependent hydrolase